MLSARNDQKNRALTAWFFVEESVFENKKRNSAKGVPFLVAAKQTYYATGGNVIFVQKIICFVFFVNNNFHNLVKNLYFFYKILKKQRKKQMSLFKAIATFGGFTLISRVTGFLRDVVIANFLGAGAVSDAFFVAFKLPNLFRNLFAEGAFNAAFVPLVSQKLVTDGKKKSIFFASQAISVLAFIVLAFVILMEVVMPYIIPLLAPGFVHQAEKIVLTTELCRITFPFLLFISIVSFQSGILNSVGKFAAPAAAPIILNLTMISSAFIFLPLGISTSHGIAFGITFAGILEVLWLTFFLHKQGIHIHPYIRVFKMFKNPDIKLLFKRIAPGILGAGIYQINMAVDTILVSLVGTGAISWLYYANRLQQLPLGVVGAAISVALLPLLSHHLKAGEGKEAKETQDKAVEYAFLLSLPAAAMLIALAYPIVNILFQHGKFSGSDTVMTAYAVIAYSFGLPAYVLVKALAPNFFARGDTKTPVKYSAVVLIFNIFANLVLMQFFGHIGIAAATSLSAFISLAQYVRGLKKRNYWSFSKELLKKNAKIFLASALMGIAVYASFAALLRLLPGIYDFAWILRFGIISIIGIFGLVVFFIFARILKIFNISDLVHTLRRKKC